MKKGKIVLASIVTAAALLATGCGGGGGGGGSSAVVTTNNATGGSGNFGGNSGTSTQTTKNLSGLTTSSAKYSSGEYRSEGEPFNTVTTLTVNGADFKTATYDATAKTPPSVPQIARN